MAGEYVRARLRAKKDQDISNWLEDMLDRGNDEANLVRAGLRLLMGQDNTAVMKQPIAVKRTEKFRTAPSLDKHPKAPPKLEPKRNVEIEGTSIDDLLGQF